jgi:tetratricopeptide (TPR) repeat protein
LTVLTLASFGHGCSDHYEFLNIDDPLYVSDNRHVQAGLTGPSMWWALTALHAHNWHPVTWLSLQLDYELFGLRPWGYHLTNVLIHTASTLLLFRVFRRMTGAVWRSAVLAALFAVHPLRVESVAWVAERRDVLCTLFGMLTLCAYVRFAERPGLPRYLLVVGAFCLALMSKPMAVTLPGVLLLLDYWPLRRFRPRGPDLPAPDGTRSLATPHFPQTSLPKLLLEKLPLFALAASVSVVTLIAQQKMVMSLQSFPLGVRVANAMTAYVRYLGKMAWPTDLAVHYPHPGDTLSTAQVAGAAFLLATLTVLALWAARRYPYVAVGWLWYLGTLVPVIGLVQLTSQAMANRFSYVPSVGILLVAVWGTADLARRWRFQELAALGAAALLTASVLTTWAEVLYWRNSLTLWGRALEVTERNATAHNHYGAALFTSGQAEEAREHFAAALAINPRYRDAHYNLGLIALGEQRHGAAAEHFRAALEIDPENGLALNGLGMALFARGKCKEAAALFARAVTAAPDLALAHNRLGECLRRECRVGDSLEYFRRAAELQPGDVDYRFDFVLALQETGRPAAALGEYRRIGAGDPAWPGKAAQRAWVLATHPDPRRRNADLAVRFAEDACAADRGRNPQWLDILAAAYAEAGTFDRAVATARKALSVLSAAGDATLADRVRGRLRLYESGKPFRAEPGALPP